MAFTKRQLAAAVSLIYLLILTAVAAYALGTIRQLSLPIPTILAGLTVALPSLTGLTMGSSSLSSLQRSRQQKQQQQQHHQSPKKRNPSTALPTTPLLNVLLVLQTVLATLAGTHLAPRDGLTCGLDEAWQAMYARKDAAAVRRVQDGLACCGLRSVRDRAWPFQRGAGAGNGACAARYERTESCLAGWRGAETRCAALMLAVVVLVFGWMVLVAANPLERETWLHGVLPSYRPAEDSDGNATRRLAIEHGQEPYSDDAPGHGGGRDAADAAPTRESADEREPDPSSQLPLRVQPSQLRDGGNAWVE